MSEQIQFEDYIPDSINSLDLNYANTYRGLAFIAGQYGDVNARLAYLRMAEWFDQ